MRLRWVAYWTGVGLLIAIFATTYGRELIHRRELSSYVRAREMKKEELEDALARRTQRVEFFKTQEGQEWIARDQLNMALPGEKIFRFDVPQSEGKALPEQDDSAIIIQ